MPTTTEVDWSSLFSLEAQALQTPSLAGFVSSFAGKEDVLAMHVGLPPDRTFPLTWMSLGGGKGGRGVGTNGISTASMMNGNHTATSNGTHYSSVGKAALSSSSSPSSSPWRLDISDPAKISAAQQYIFSHGHPGLLDWIRSLIHRCHAPTIPVDVVVTSGAVNAISHIVTCLCNRGDTVIVDEYAYSHVTECVLLPRGLTLLPIKMDDQGMIPETLDDHLTRWRPPSSSSSSSSPSSSSSTQGVRPPRLLYTVPSGHNPTGIIMSQERKERIYEVCQKHGVIILEDDAYYWLQFGVSKGSEERQPNGLNGLHHMQAEGDAMMRMTRAHEPSTPGSDPEGRRGAYEGGHDGSSSEEEVPGLDLPPSFLSMDTDGRVVRVDTLSKLLGPGYRIGWATCAPALASKLGMAVQGGSVGPCSLTQVLIAEMINSWGPDKFEGFIKGIQLLYRCRAQAAVAAVREELAGLAEVVVVPRAGMFLWLKFTAIPDFDERAAAAFVEERVVGVPGRLFRALNAGRDAAAAARAAKGGQNGAAPPPPLPGSAPLPSSPSSSSLEAEEEEPCPFMRVSFGGLDEAKIREGIRRMGVALRRLQGGYQV